jgi:hypothetical protein
MRKTAATSALEWTKVKHAGARARAPSPRSRSIPATRAREEAIRRGVAALSERGHTRLSPPAEGPATIMGRNHRVNSRIYTTD